MSSGMLLSLLLGLLGCCFVAAETVTIGGIFELCSSDSHRNYEQSQYLATFLMAIREINDKSDGVLDELLPNTTLRVIVRPVCDPIDVAKAAINIVEKDSVDGEVGVDAVLSTIESFSRNDVFLSEVFTSSKTLHLLTREMHPDMHLNVITHHPLNVNIAPDAILQMWIWQSILCQYGYTTVSLFYSDSIFGMESLAALTDGHYCSITLASSHAVAPGQTYFGDDIQEAYDTLSIVQMVVLDMNTAVPFLQQAFDYGLIRENHQVILNNELLTNELIDRLEDAGADVVGILRGSLGVQYSPSYGLSKTSEGQSFQERFRNQPNTLIDGVCDASLDDSDGTHYLYRNADGSRCAGLNHSSFQSASDFATNVGLVYDGVVALAKGLHELVYNHSTAVTSDSIVNILETVSFSGASGKFALGTNTMRESSGLVRRTGYYYDNIGFNADSLRDTGTAFVRVGTWDDENFVRPCAILNDTCTKHVFNTRTGSLLPHHPRYVGHMLPEVLKIGLFINTFTEDGSVNEVASQHLAAFLMAVREINNKTDGIADDLLPDTKIVVSVRSSYNFLQTQSEVLKLAHDDFGSGVDIIISANNIYDTIYAYYMQNSLPILVSHSTESSFFLDNPLLAPMRLQMSSAPSMYGTAMQSIVCNEFGYRKIGVFVSQKLHYLQAYSEFISSEHCEFDILSYRELTDKDDIDPHISAAKNSGARVFVLFTDAAHNKRLVSRGYERGLFGKDRQVFTHANDVSYELFDHDADDMMHGFVVIKESPNKALVDTTTGKDFARRWREQPATLDQFVNGSQKCNDDRDNNDRVYLYRSPAKLNNTPVCSGMDFSEFSVVGDDIALYAPHSYDAIMMFAKGYHKVIYDYHMPVVNPYVVYGTILSQVQFDGASGWFDMNDGSTVSTQRGTRRVGQYYDVHNYVKSGVHNIVQGNNTFLEPAGKYLIGTWEASRGYVACNATAATCKTAHYNTDDGSLVLETPHPVHLHHASIGLKVVSVLLFSLSIMFMILYVFRRHYDIIGQAYCGMLPVICIGACCFAARLWLTTMPLTDDICALRLIGIYACFVMFWGPIAMSSVRAYRLKWESSRVTKYNMFNIQLAQLLLTIGVVGYCAIVGFGLRAYKSYDYEMTSDNRTEVCAYCGYTTKVHSNILISVQMVMLTWGLRGAYKAKNIMDKMGETRISYGVLMMFIITLVISYPMWMMLDLTPDQNIILVEYNLGGLHVVCLAALLFQKLYMLQHDDDKSAEFSCAAYYGEEESKSYKARSSVQSLMNAMTRDSKEKLCRRQINEWMSLLMSVDHALRDLPQDVNASVSLSNGVPMIRFGNAHSAQVAVSSNRQELEDIPESSLEN